MEKAKFIAQKMEWHRLVQIPAQPDRSFLLWMFGLSLIILTVAEPIATTILSNPPQFSEISCPVGTEVVYFRYSPGSSINLVADDAMRKSYVPNIRVSNFRRMLDQYLTRDPRVPELVKELAKLNPNTTLIYKLDLKTDETIWTIADSALIPKESGIVGACGRRTTNPAATKLHNADGAYLRFLFYANSMTLVSR